MTDTRTVDTPLSNVPSTPQDPKKAPKAKKPAAKPKAKAAPKPKPASKPSDGPRGKSGIVMNMMLRPKGTTTAELLKATGWPAITAKGQGTAFAKKYGYKFAMSKAKGEVTRYYLKAKN
jgi:outer membrane biosynthesis protein TonB